MKNLIKYFEENNIHFDDDVIRKFEEYRSEILKWNEFVNLTAIVNPEEFTMKHFVDSVTCYNLAEYQDASNVLDLGTGAGFPGVPLAILSPEKEFTLVDSLNKRLKIINELCENIGITNVRTVHGRAEDLAQKKEHREKYSLCISRAVANLSTLSEYCLPFVGKGGYMMAYKGGDGLKEAEEAKNAIKTLGGRLHRIVDTPIDEKAEAHKILIIKKIAGTPAKYPRKAGSPSKEPLK